MKRKTGTSLPGSRPSRRLPAASRSENPSAPARCTENALGRVGRGGGRPRWARRPAGRHGHRVPGRPGPWARPRRHRPAPGLGRRERTSALSDEDLQLPCMRRLCSRNVDLAPRRGAVSHMDGIGLASGNARGSDAHPTAEACAGRSRETAAEPIGLPRSSNSRSSPSQGDSARWMAPTSPMRLSRRSNFGQPCQAGGLSQRLGSQVTDPVVVEVEMSQVLPGTVGQPEPLASSPMRLLTR